MIYHEDSQLLHVPLIEAQFLLITSEEQYNTFIEENPDDTQDITPWSAFNGYVARWTGKEGAHFVMALALPHYDVICHEATHMAHLIMEYKGIPIGIVNTEVEAYLSQFIFREVVAAIAPAPKKAKKKSKKKKKK